MVGDGFRDYFVPRELIQQKTASESASDLNRRNAHSGIVRYYTGVLCGNRPVRHGCI